MPRVARHLLLAAVVIPAALAAGTGRAAANSCETDLILPAHPSLPAGCPLPLYARVGANLVPGEITADRGGSSIVVGQAPTTSQPGQALVHRTWFDPFACAWIDSNVAFDFDVYTVAVASQPGDRLTWGGGFPSVEVTAAAPCPAPAMSWQPACADPLPPPACVTPGGDGGLCDGGSGYGSDGGVGSASAGGAVDEGGCQASRGGGGAWLALALAALVGARRRRSRALPPCAGA